jgi:hypothetical protein
VEYVGFGFSLVGFLIALLVWRRSLNQAKRAQAEQDEMAETLRSKMNAHAEAERRAQKLGTDLGAMERNVKRLENELAQAVARRDEKRIARAVWNLELERSHRQWKDVLVPRSGVRGGGITAGMQLQFALGQEVERLREEVGVSITYAGDLSRDIEPEIALGVLRIAEEILAVAGKRADEISINLAESSSDVSVGAQCEGWDDYDEADSASVIDSVEKMAERLDGRFWVERIDESVTMRLVLPAGESGNELELADEAEGEEAGKTRAVAAEPGHSVDVVDVDGHATDDAEQAGNTEGDLNQPASSR